MEAFMNQLFRRWMTWKGAFSAAVPFKQQDLIQKFVLLSLVALSGSVNYGQSTSLILLIQGQRFSTDLTETTQMRRCCRSPSKSKLSQQHL